MHRALKTIMKIKYDGWHVYIHNFGHFDGIFMLDALSILGTLKPVIRDGRILKASFTFRTIGADKKMNKTMATLHFKDSYLILNASLKNLCVSFNVSDPKIDFPIFFLSEKGVDLKYVGEVPGYKYFAKANTPQFTLEDYEIYKSKYKGK